MIYKKIYQNEFKNYRFCVCIGLPEVPSNQYRVNEILSKMELLQYRKLKSTKKKVEFFRSRYMAKIAIKELDGYREVALSDIEIGKGILNNPILLGEYAEYSLSISHGGGYVVVVVYTKALIIGVDIEPICINKVYSNLWLSEYEKQCKPKNVSESVYGLAIWTCKEALGKCLCLGLQVNYEIYAMKSVTVEDGVIKSTFHNFHGLVAYTYISEEYLFTLVLPKTLKIGWSSIEEVTNAL